MHVLRHRGYRLSDTFLPYRFVSVRGYCLLFTISSSSIDSLCDLCSACLLPTVHPGNTASHLNRSYTLLGGSPQQAEGFALEHFTILYFYLGRLCTLQSSYTSRRLVDRIRITVLEYGLGPLPLPRTIAYAVEQLHQQDVWQIVSVLRW